MSTAPSRTGSKAIAWAKTQTSNPSRSWHNLCLMFVRSCFGVPAREPNAKRAWETARKQHKTTDADSIPAGVPVFWKTRTANWHIALSVGGGYCYSSDVGGRGKIGKIGIDALSRAWGATLLGWSEDVNGVTVYTPLAKPKVALAKAVKAAKTEPAAKGRPMSAKVDTKLIGKALVKEGLLAKGYPDGHWGRAQRDAYAAWQRKLGYRGKDADGIPGGDSLKQLGKKHGFTVKA